MSSVVRPSSPDPYVPEAPRSNSAPTADHPKDITPPVRSLSAPPTIGLTRITPPRRSGSPRDVANTRQSLLNTRFRVNYTQYLKTILSMPIRDLFIEGEQLQNRYFQVITDSNASYKQIKAIKKLYQATIKSLADSLLEVENALSFLTSLSKRKSQSEQRFAAFWLSTFQDNGISLYIESIKDQLLGDTRERLETMYQTIHRKELLSRLRGLLRVSEEERKAGFEQLPKKTQQQILALLKQGAEIDSDTIQAYINILDPMPQDAFDRKQHIESLLPKTERQAKQLYWLLTEQQQLSLGSNPSLDQIKDYWRTALDRIVPDINPDFDAVLKMGNRFPLGLAYSPSSRATASQREELMFSMVAAIVEQYPDRSQEIPFTSLGSGSLRQEWEILQFLMALGYHRFDISVIDLDYPLECKDTTIQEISSNYETFGTSNDLETHPDDISISRLVRCMENFYFLVEHTVQKVSEHHAAHISFYSDPHSFINVKKEDPRARIFLMADPKPVWTTNDFFQSTTNLIHTDKGVIFLPYGKEGKIIGPELMSLKPFVTLDNRINLLNEVQQYGLYFETDPYLSLQDLVENTTSQGTNSLVFILDPQDRKPAVRQISMREIPRLFAQSAPYRTMMANSF